MAIESNITADYFTGEDKVVVVTVYQPDGVTPQPLDNFAALSWMLKRRRTDADAAALIEKTLTDGIAVTDPDNGVLQVSVTRADIADLHAGVAYHHELKRMDAPETVLTYGLFVLTQAVHDA